jgi:chromate reductase
LANQFAENAGAKVSEYDLKKNPLPFYDQDIEDKSIPKEVKAFYKEIDAADVVMIASPEYNYSIPGALKNAIDWASRNGNHLDGKWVIMFGASPGRFGTVRMQEELRKVLMALNTQFLPQPEVYIARAEEAFDEKGSLTNEKSAELLQELVEQTLELALS